MRRCVASMVVCLSIVGGESHASEKAQPSGTLAPFAAVTESEGQSIRKRGRKRRGPMMRSLRSPSALRIPKHRRDGAKMRQLIRDNFEALAPHLVEVARDCARPRDLMLLKKGTSPFVLPSPNHAGPHYISKRLFDRLVFAGSFAHQKGGYKIAVAIGRRSLQDQATLWNWRLLEKFAWLRKKNPKADPKVLARRARPAGEVASPRAFGCNSPHITGGAVDVVLLDKRGRSVVGFSKKFYYGSQKAYRKNFLLSKKKDAVMARLLEEFMYSAGFVRYCREAWHFEAGPTMLYRTWKRAGRPGRCFGAGKGGSWDPRREPDSDHVADLLVGLPRS